MGLVILLLVNLFCKFGMLKSKVTISIIVISVLFAILKAKFGDLCPIKFLNKSVWMSLNSVFSQSKFTRVLILSVSHSPSKFLSFKTKFIMGLFPISLTNFICSFGFIGVSYDISKPKIFFFFLIFPMLQLSHKTFYG